MTVPYPHSLLALREAAVGSSGHQANPNASFATMAFNTGEPGKVVDRSIACSGDPLNALVDIRTFRTCLGEREVDFVKWARPPGVSSTPVATVLGANPVGRLGPLTGS